MISRLFLSLAMKCTAGNFSFQTCFSLENDFPKRNMIEKRSYPLVIKHVNGTFLFMRMRIDTIDYWRVLEVLLMYPHLVPEKHIRIPDGKLGVDITPEWTFRKLYLATRWCPRTSPNLLLSRLTMVYRCL